VRQARGRGPQATSRRTSGSGSARRHPLSPALSSCSTSVSSAEATAQAARPIPPAIIGPPTSLPARRPTGRRKWQDEMKRRSRRNGRDVRFRYRDVGPTHHGNRRRTISTNGAISRANNASSSSLASLS
jgi:hypothetical protein